MQSDLGHTHTVLTSKVINRTKVKSMEVFVHRYGELMT